MLPSPQIARYKELTPTKKTFEVNGIRIPEEAYALVAAKDNIVLMEPEEDDSGRAAIAGPPGMKIFVATCPPGQGPALHLHETSTETFIPLTGTWEITWGDRGEHRTVVERFDTVFVPKGWYRAFKNTSSSDATLIVFVNYDPEEGSDTTITDAATARVVQERFGCHVIEAFRSIGIEFDEPRDNQP